MARNVRDLTRQECVEILGRHRVGRIAVTSGALPAIVPVDYALDDGRIVFRTPSDGLLAAYCRNAVVAFEVDDFLDGSGSGVSVLVVGLADHVDPTEWLRARNLGPGFTPPAETDEFIAVSLEMVSGRRVARGVNRLESVAR